MRNRIVILAAALAVTLLTAQAAVAADVAGRVVRVDPGAQIIFLDDSRAFRITPNTIVLVDNQPVTFSTVQPGQTVIIRSGEAVAVSPSASPPTVTAPGGTVIVQAPGAPAAVARQTVYGRVIDVDNVRLDLTFMPSR